MKQLKISAVNKVPVKANTKDKDSRILSSRTLQGQLGPRSSTTTLLKINLLG